MLSGSRDETERVKAGNEKDKKRLSKTLGGAKGGSLRLAEGVLPFPPLPRGGSSLFLPCRQVCVIEALS